MRCSFSVPVTRTMEFTHFGSNAPKVPASTRITCVSSLPIRKIFLAPCLQVCVQTPSMVTSFPARFSAFARRESISKADEVVCSVVVSEELFCCLFPQEVPITATASRAIAMLSFFVFIVTFCFYVVYILFYELANGF